MYPPSEIVNTVVSAAGIKSPVIPYKISKAVYYLVHNVQKHKTTSNRNKN